MRVIVDSNVAIASVAARGLCEAVMEVCLERHQIIICEGILAEIQEKLTGKIKVPHSTCDSFITLLRRNAELFIPEDVPEGLCRDPDDRMVLGLVAPANALAILTGDKDLLVIGTYKGARILSPRSFWESNIKHPEL